MREAAYKALVRIGNDAVLPLILRLNETRHSDHERVCRALGQLGNPRAVAPLIGVLGDSTEEVREAAAAALQVLGEGRLTSAFLGALESKPEALDELERLAAEGDLRAVEPLTAVLSHLERRSKAAGEALVRIGTAAMEVLLSRLRDDQSSVRWAVCAVLGQLEDQRAIEPLISLLGDSSWDVRYAACRSLWSLCAPPPSPSPVVSCGVAAESTAGRSSDSRLPVVDLFDQLGDPNSRRRHLDAYESNRRAALRAVGPLIALLGDSEASVRRAAASALEALGEGRLGAAVLGATEGRPGAPEELARLAKGGDSRAVPPLVSLLDALDDGIRLGVCNALVRVGSTAVEPLIARLSAPHHWTRRSACEALGRLGDRRAVEPLIVHLGASNGDEDAVTNALRALGAGRLADAFVGAMHGKQEAREELVRLAKAGDVHAVAPLIARLRAPEWYERRQACEALGMLGDRRAVEPLIARLDDPEESVRRDASKALAQLGDARATEPLIARLRDSDPHVRKAACSALGGLGDLRAVEPLMAHLNDSDESHRAAACQALGQLHDPRAVLPLIARLGDGGYGAQAAACDALIALGSAAVEPLIACLADTNRDVRRNACKALGRLEDRRAVDALIVCLSDVDSIVLREACEALRRLGDVRAVERLIMCLGHPFSALRQAACTVLGGLGDARAVEPLIARLADSEKDVHDAACKALAQLRDRRAVEPLIACLDGSPHVRVAACTSLGRLADPRAVEPLVARLGDSDSIVRQSAGEALTALGEKRLADAVLGALERKPEALMELSRLAGEGDLRPLEPLLAHLGHSGCSVRRAACEALGRLGDPRALEYLLARLDDYSDECSWACKTLGQLGDPRAVEPLVARLGDPNSNVRQSAGEALTALGERRLANAVLGALEGRPGALKELSRLAGEGDLRPLQTLLTHLNSFGSSARRAACEALGRLGDPRAFEHLLARLDGRDRDEYRWACKTLGQLGDRRAVEPLVARLGDSDSSARQFAGEALTALGERRLANAVLGALEGRRGALEGLAHLAKEGDLRAMQPLLAQFGDTHSGLGDAAGRALVVFGSAALEPLVACLRCESLQVRHRACEALGQLADPRAIAALIASLRDKTNGVAAKACEVLGRLANPGAVEPLIACLEPNSHVRGPACDALGQLGDPRAIVPLIDCLDDRDPQARRSAAKALTALGEGRLANAVVGALENKPEALEELSLLAKDGERRATRPLLARLADWESGLREAACRALGWLGDPSAIESLIGMLSDSWVSDAAQEALVRFGGRAVEALAAQVDDSQSPVRARAASVLASISDPMKLRWNEMLCGTCLTRCSERTASFEDARGERIEASWFVCRTCGGSGSIMRRVQQVLAVLDEGWTEDAVQSCGLVRGNWLKRHAVFDFDSVEIVQAGDFEIERLCIAVGNDTDERRRAAYKGMLCLIARQSALTENSIRILRSVFGEVRVSE